jgi:hypothetical protein
MYMSSLGHIHDPVLFIIKDERYTFTFLYKEYENRKAPRHVILSTDTQHTRNVGLVLDVLYVRLSGL